MTSEHDNGQVNIVGALAGTHPPAEFQPVHPWQEHVKQHQVNPPGVKPSERCLGIVRMLHSVCSTGKQMAERGVQCVIIFDDQDHGRLRWHQAHSSWDVTKAALAGRVYGTA